MILDSSTADRLVTEILGAVDGRVVVLILLSFGLVMQVQQLVRADPGEGPRPHAAAADEEDEGDGPAVDGAQDLGDEAVGG